MDDQLKFFLKEAPTSVKELARLTGKSTSTLYKALKGDDLIITDGPNGKLYSLKPDATEAPLNGAGATAAPDPSETPTQGAGDAPASSLAVEEREEVDYDPAAAPTLGKRGRRPTAAGKKLTATASDNPRRKASHGYKSLQIIIDNPGITTEDYLAKGGRLNDLRWDIARDRVKAEG